MTAVEPRKEAEVLVSREFQVVVRRFECDADPPGVVSVPRSEISAQNGDGPSVTIEQTNEDVLGRTLSGSAWPRKPKISPRSTAKVTSRTAGRLAPG